MRLAIFDIDNTLIAGDSDLLWGEFLCERNYVDSNVYKAEHEKYYKDYLSGKLDINNFLKFQLKVLGENDLNLLKKWRKDFFEEKITYNNINIYPHVSQEFEKNEIKLVIFAPPLHRIYLDHISDSEEENFKKIIEDSQNELYFPYYDFSYKYADLPIWTDLTHVAVDNEKSLTYTDDVLKIIFEEINH